MTRPENWPEELTDDKEVLFIQPYSPEEKETLRLSGSTDAAMKEAFEQANVRDPELRHFEDIISLYKTMFGLDGYVVGDDLIVLSGDRDALQQVHDAVKKDYFCFFDTVGNFLNWQDRDNAGVKIDGPALN